MDAGEKVHATVEQEMHLLNGYLRKLLVRYIGALLQACQKFQTDV